MLLPDFQWQYLPIFNIFKAKIFLKKKKFLVIFLKKLHEMLLRKISSSAC